MRTTAGLVVLAVLVLVATLAAATPASADDASVKRAWDSEDPAFRALGTAQRREGRRWERRGFTRDGRVLRLLRRGERLSRTVVARLEAEQPSSAEGARARDAAIRSTRVFARYFAAERRFVRAMGRPMSRRAQRRARRATRLYRRSHRLAAEGREIFQALGLT